MKRIRVWAALVLGAIFLCSAARGQESWQCVYEPDVAAPLQKIAFPSDQNGWVLTFFPGAITGGPSPEWEVPLYGTHDAGRNWTPCPWPAEVARLLDPTMSGEAGFVLDARHVWIVGHETCCWTADAARTWTLADPESLRGFDFVDVSFADTLHGWGIGLLSGSTSSWLGRTVDAGKTWTFVELPEMTRPHGVLALDSLTAIGVGARGNGAGLIVRTGDGGGTFSMHEDPEGIICIHKAGERLIFALGEKGLLLRSGDTGVSWQAVATLPGDSARYRALAFADTLHGLVAAGYSVLRTEDGGRTWIRSALRFNDPVVDLAFSPSGTAWAISSGQIYRSTDFGQTWVPQLEHPRVCFQHVSFADENIGLASGTYLFRTRDGGVTWERNDTLAGPVAMMSPSRGWLLRKGVGLFVTTNGGASWALVDTALGTYERLYADSLGRLILSAYDWRAKTTLLAWSDDAGSHWRQFSWVDYHILGFHFADSQVGWAFGARVDSTTGEEVPLVLRTTDGGGTWKAAVLPPGRWQAGPVVDVGFADSGRGWAVDGQSKIWCSRDGGRSWSLQLERADSWFTRLAAVDSNEAWAVGAGIFRTVDGGAHWRLVGPEGSQQIWWRDVCFVGRDLAFFVGESEVWRWSRPSGVADTRGSLPRELHLSPCYPNPFNQQTRIVFSAPGRGEVSLIVYDTAGRAVRTLYLGGGRSGQQTALWDGRDDAGCALPTGLYLIRLRVPGRVATRKAVLIR